MPSHFRKHNAGRRGERDDNRRHENREIPPNEMNSDDLERSEYRRLSDDPEYPAGFSSDDEQDDSAELSNEQHEAFYGPRLQDRQAWDTFDESSDDEAATAPVSVAAGGPEMLDIYRERHMILEGSRRQQLRRQLQPRRPNLQSVASRNRRIGTLLTPAVAPVEPFCPICREVWDGKHKSCHLPCGHVFGEECITEWLHLASTCPTCRREFGEIWSGQNSEIVNEDENNESDMPNDEDEDSQDQDLEEPMAQRELR